MLVVLPENQFAFHFRDRLAFLICGAVYTPFWFERMRCMNHRTFSVKTEEDETRKYIMNPIVHYYGGVSHLEAAILVTVHSYLVICTIHLIGLTVYK